MHHVGPPLHCAMEGHLEGPLEGYEAQKSLSIPPEPVDQDFIPYDTSSKTAYYNQASEKSISLAEAKMMYRRHMLETSGHPQDILKRAGTMPSYETEIDLGRVRSGGFRHLLLPAELK